LKTIGLIKTRYIQRFDVRGGQSIGRGKKTPHLSILWNFSSVCAKTPNSNQKPVAVMLSQLINMAAKFGVPVAPGSKKTFQRLIAGGGAGHPVVDADSVTMPTAEQLSLFI
jgi:hypothetical protein